MTPASVTALAAATLLLLAPRAAPAQEPTKNPHGDLKEPCASCHSPTAWQPAKVSAAFKHSPRRFPLEGAHAQTNCRACHATLDFKGASTKCAACHTDVHQGELGSDCAVCHSPRNFIDRSVMQQRHQTTRFPLSGAHVFADCLACHPPVQQGHMTFVGRPVECFACHLPAYNATVDPPHQPAGFPTTCESCHTTVAWNRSGFNHSATLFPLTGAHLAVACSTCHGDGVYKGKSTACVSCHVTDYNGTSNPNHTAAGFPTTCAGCHNTTTWLGATFNHDASFFPIYSGAHNGQWSSCATCHTNSANYGVFTCLSCHQHDKTTTDSHHQGISGYRYDSQSCYSCHPRGTSG